MSSAGENAVSLVSRGKDLLPRSQLGHRTEGLGREPELPLFLTRMVLHPNWTEAHPWYMKA